MTRDQEIEILLEKLTYKACDGSSLAVETMNLIDSLRADLARLQAAAQHQEISDPGGIEKLGRDMEASRAKGAVHDLEEMTSQAEARANELARKLQRLKEENEELIFSVRSLLEGLEGLAHHAARARGVLRSVSQPEGKVKP